MDINEKAEGNTLCVSRDHIKPKAKKSIQLPSLFQWCFFVCFMIGVWLREKAW